MSGCGYAFLYLGTILFTRICISIGLKTNGHHQLQAKHGVLEVTVANNIHHCAITIFSKSSSSNRIIDRNRLVGINTPGSANKHTHTHTHPYTSLHLYTHFTFILFSFTIHLLWNPHSEFLLQVLRRCPTCYILLATEKGTFSKGNSNNDKHLQ